MNKNFKNVFLIGIPVVILTTLAIPSTRDWIFDMTKLLGSMDPEAVKDYIRSFGSFAAVVSFLLMMFQSVAAPLPAFLITFANAAVFGWIGGAILSWTSAMAGAALCFWIARLYGRGVVEKFTGKSALDSVDGFFEKYGTKSIIIARLLPFMPFDIVSYAGGLTSMSFRSFFIATGIGQLPATLIYSYAGEKLTGGGKAFVTGLLILFAAVTLTFLLKSLLAERMRVKKGNDEKIS